MPRGWGSSPSTPLEGDRLHSVLAAILCICFLNVLVLLKQRSTWSPGTVLTLLLLTYGI